MTDDGAFRVMAAVVSSTALDCAAVQSADGVLAKRLGELLCGAVLVRETMQPGKRLQIILYDSMGGRLVADSQPDGSSRGIVNPGSDDAVDLHRDGRLEVSYTLRNGELHQGIVGLPVGSDVATALMTYLHTSEQITAFVSVQAMVRGDSMAVGGFVAQVTPEAEPEGIEEMTAHLAELSSVEELLHSRDPSHAMIEAVFRDRDFSILAESPLRFGCTCSQERMMVGLASLPKEDLAELIASGQGIEVSCDACGRRYDIAMEHLVGLLVNRDDSGLKN